MGWKVIFDYMVPINWWENVVDICFDCRFGGKKGGMITGSSVAVTGNTPHFVHAFVTSAKEFIPIFQSLISVYKANPTIVIWISWYKKSAGIPTDVTEDTIRDYALQHDLVDVKVCAVSEKWSALKLVVRKERR